MAGGVRPGGECRYLGQLMRTAVSGARHPVFLKAVLKARSRSTDEAVRPPGLGRAVKIVAGDRVGRPPSCELVDFSEITPAALDEQAEVPRAEARLWGREWRRRLRSDVEGWFPAA